MKSNTSTYLNISLLLPAMLMAGCADEALYTVDPIGNPDAITFSAQTVDASSAERTRSEDAPLYEPLELTGEDGATQLYLHTFETNRIGFQPGDFCESEQATRGNQVASATDLLTYHENFKVLGRKKSDGSQYLGWVDTNIADSDRNIWHTNRTEYWPAAERLSFYAVSPSKEFNNLSSLSTADGIVTFDYEARKGAAGADKDAEAQNDLLISTYECDKSTHGGKAPLKFHHALSAVKFAIRDVLGGEVVNIKIKGIASAGHCRFAPLGATGEYGFVWDNHTGNETYSQNFNYTIDSSHNVSASDEENDILLNATMPEKTFMLIPQQIPDDAYIEVTLKRSSNVVAAGAKEQITVKGRIKDNLVEEWKAGYEYVYTISTTKDNWVYVFDAVGNEAGGTTENIFMYSPTVEEYDTYGDNGYFKVNSYRYRANDQNHIEALPWTASHGGSYSYNVDGGGEVAYPVGKPDIKYVTASQWITDTFSTPLKGAGSPTGKEWERHDLKVMSHYVSTDWEGDEVMQAYEPYSGYSKAAPYDLSTFGGAKPRTTANCYIVDRGGWYMFPLVYGNAIVNGDTNESSYKCANTTLPANRLEVLYDYQNQPITQPEIKGVTTNAAAQLIWQDAYNMVSEIELVTINGAKMIRFYVNRNDLQQGNAIIALTDKPNGTVMWSWHIWATEHWLDPNTRLPHAYDTANSRFATFTAAPKTNMRQWGDVAVTYNQKGRSYMMSAYNLGWCDPKKVLYLKRKSTMEFVQYLPDGTTKSGKTDVLPIIQQGDVVDYKYGNNTYYQWGRKDPMRGYFNHESSMKVVFGPRKSDIQSQKGRTLQDGIRNPNVFYGKVGEASDPERDWLTNGGFYNLWNNNKDSNSNARNDTSDYEDLWSHTKTVYDPSPAGYLVPNAGVLHVVQKNFSTVWTRGDFKKTYTSVYYTKKNGVYYYYEDQAKTKLITPDPVQKDTWSGGTWPLDLFHSKINGKVIDRYNYMVYGKGSEGINDAIFFSSTGNRWWTDDWKIDSIGAGGNFGRNVSYAWSNRYTTNYTAYGMALGLDTNTIEESDGDLYYVGGQFIGRRAMGRPVRAIREP